MGNFPDFTVPALQVPLIHMPKLRNPPEEFFEDLVAHIRELEHGLNENERIAFVYNQTGEVIAVEKITRRGMAFILWGRDGNGAETNVFANINTFQIAFKIVDVGAQEKSRPIGFTQTP